jgi:hypothetical protein
MNIVSEFVDNGVYAIWRFVHTTINTYVMVIARWRVEDSVSRNANSFAASAVSELVRDFTVEKVHEYSK